MWFSVRGSHFRQKTLTCIYLIYNPTEVKVRQNQETSTEVCFSWNDLKESKHCKERQYLNTDFYYNSYKVLKRKKTKSFLTLSAKCLMMKALFDIRGFSKRAHLFKCVLYSFWAQVSSVPLGILGRKKEKWLSTKGLLVHQQQKTSSYGQLRIHPSLQHKWTTNEEHSWGLPGGDPAHFSDHLPMPGVIKSIFNFLAQ